MLREITLTEAIARIEHGEMVPCLRPTAPDADWHQMMPETLNGILAGIVCLANVDEAEQTEQEPQPSRLRKKMSEEDRQKIIGLYACGWKTNNIAEEMGCHPNTVRVIIRDEKERLEGTSDDSADK